MTTSQAAATIYARTDLGRTREHNEDAFLVADLTLGRSSLHSEVRTIPVGARGVLLLVADGMGGSAAGGQSDIRASSGTVRYHLLPAECTVPAAAPKTRPSMRTCYY